MVDRKHTSRVTGEFNVRAYSISVLRRSSYRTPMRQAAIRLARRSRGQYACAACKGIFSNKEIQVDHIERVIPVTGWDSLDAFAARLFCPASGLQILCKPCHQVKSQAENKQAREYKANGTKKRVKQSPKKMAKGKNRSQGRSRRRLG